MNFDYTDYIKQQWLKANRDAEVWHYTYDNAPIPAVPADPASQPLNKDAEIAQLRIDNNRLMDENGVYKGELELRDAEIESLSQDLIAALLKIANKES